MNRFPSFPGTADALQRGGSRVNLDKAASVSRDCRSKLSRSWESIVGLMFRRLHTRYVALVLFFTFCQVIGTMCALPDLSETGENTFWVEESMACPMDGTMMCPPSLTSSPERQMKNSMVMDDDHETIGLSLAAMRTVPSARVQWSWSSAYSIVPISIGSSSVLRI